MFYYKHETKLAVAGATIVFLALVRTVAEPFRLHYLHGDIAFNALAPLLTGALAASAGLFFIALASIFKKYLAANLAAVITVILLMIIKAVMI